ncbi:Gfo/Idh/MocA family oxidoreductase [Candidatus Micrarchaeota archaeon]|nr:Gfo/Idh/MocA family oxidoreductase [Candidatus Micrarchaeota archaeon]
MRVLFIGCGSIGLRHIGILRQIDPKLEIIAYRTSTTNSDLLDKLGVVYYTSLNEAFTKKLDAVFVTNPSSEHVKTILKVKDHTNYIFVEKPLSTNLNHASELSSLKNIFLIGYSLRYHPVLTKVKELVDSGVLGRLIYAEASVGQYLPYWRPNIDYRKSHTAKKELSGSTLLELSHELDYLCWLIGYPSELFCRSGKFSDLEIETDDIVEVIISFDNSTIARIHLDLLLRKPSRTGRIIGTKGDISFDILNGSVELNTGTTETFHFKEYDMYTTQMKHFLNIVNGKAKPLVTLSEGLNVLKLAIAAQHSSEKNKVVEVKL